MRIAMAVLSGFLAVGCTAGARSERIATHDVSIALQRAGFGDRTSARFASDGAVQLPGLAARVSMNALRVAIDDARFVEIASPRRGAPEVDGDRVVQRDPERHVDVVHVARGAELEELRVVHDPSAAHTHYTLTLSPSLAGFAVENGRVRVFDRDGVTWFSTAPVIAIDAKGVRRRATVTSAADGFDVDVDVVGAAFPIVVDPAWSTAPAMSVGRAVAAAVALGGNKLLVTGGAKEDLRTAIASAEIFDVATKTWSSAGSMATARFGHAAVALPDGTVMVAGGQTASFAGTAAVEFFNPTTSTWSAGAAMPVGHSGYHLIALGTKVYAISGGNVSNVVSNRVDVFDTTSRTWSSGPSLNEARGVFGAAVISGGRILVAGGFDGSSGLKWMQTAEIFNGTSWTTTGAMSTKRMNFTLTTLPSGKVIAVGGTNDSGAVSTAEIFDPATGTWSAAAPPKYQHAGHVAVVVADKLLVVGSALTAAAKSVELYDPVTNTWSDAGSLVEGRDRAVAAALGSTVVVTGGYFRESSTVSYARASTELFALSGPGTACSTPGECASGFCADGVCCDKACTGSCEACNLAGSTGTCAPVTGSPSPGHPACVAPYARCNAGACLTSCTVDEDCVSTHQCEASACVPKKSNGSSCMRSTQCTSGFCADGTCCDKACSNSCEACNLPGTAGTCTAITSGSPREGHPSCAPYTCGPSGCRANCATNDECAAGAVCVSGTCVNATNTCSEDGKSVVDPAGKASTCGAYKCRGGQCLTGCTTTDDCATGVCGEGGKCTEPPASAGDDEGGCAMRPRGGATSLTAALLAMALLGVGGRRRSGRSPSGPVRPRNRADRI